MRYPVSVRCAKRPWAWFWLSLVVLLIPIPWIAAWILAAVVHELGHLLAARLLQIPVTRICIDLTGARIETASMDPVQELFCAMAGPMAGGLLVLVGRIMPLVAVFAFFQTIWNLIPVGNLDGGRILRCLFTLVGNIPCKPGKERVQ